MRKVQAGQAQSPLLAAAAEGFARFASGGVVPAGALAFMDVFVVEGWSGRR